MENIIYYKIAVIGLSVLFLICAGIVVYLLMTKARAIKLVVASARLRNNVEDQRTGDLGKNLEGLLKEYKATESGPVLLELIRTIKAVGMHFNWDCTDRFSIYVDTFVSVSDFHKVVDEHFRLFSHNVNELLEGNMHKNELERLILEPVVARTLDISLMYQALYCSHFELDKYPSVSEKVKKFEDDCNQLKELKDIYDFDLKTKAVYICYETILEKAKQKLSDLLDNYPLENHDLLRLRECAIRRLGQKIYDPTPENNLASSPLLEKIMSKMKLGESACC